MLEKLTVLFTFYAVALTTDLGKLRKAHPRGRLFYFAIVVCSLYFSADYVLDAKFPDLNWLADRLMHGPAQGIVDSLKVKHV